MLRTVTVLAIVLTSTLAAADTAKDVTGALESIVSGVDEPGDKMSPPRYASGSGVAVSPASFGEARDSSVDSGEARKVVVGVSADKTAAWINADVAQFSICGDETCPKHPKPEGWYHATTLFEVKGPQPVAWQIVEPVSGKDQAAALKKGLDLQKLDEKIDKGAEDPAKLFKDTLGDPKKLAATVSDRKDAVMYGSELAERYVGGAKIKSQLAKWNLGFTVKGGVQAGITKSQTVAFVAAYVDAKSVKNPSGAVSPYRVFAIYEKTITSWKLVSLHFAFTKS
ncbi:MAG TPA: hypothetical protein VL326_03480 [Kofleriaceae bacterium]|jgi:hypothetical protein|nr:hypothetical protein [Kofleriaceae bacterium]